MAKDPVSLPYIEATRTALGDAGIESAWSTHADGRSLCVAGGAPAARTFSVEPDVSSAAFWWALAALVGGRVSVPGLPLSSSQADMHLLKLLDLDAREADAAEEGEGVVVSCKAPLRDGSLPSTLDLRACSDLVPLTAALATELSGTTRIVGAEHVQFKESRRLDTMAKGISALGGEAQVEGGDLLVGERPLTGGVVDCRGDHRLVMAFALLGARWGTVFILGAASVGKSYPDFVRHLEQSAGSHEV